MSADTLPRALQALDTALQQHPESLDTATQQLRLALASLRQRPGSISAEQLTVWRQQVRGLSEMARLRQQRCTRLAAALETAPLTYAPPRQGSRR